MLRIFSPPLSRSINVMRCGEKKLCVAATAAPAAVSSPQNDGFCHLLHIQYTKGQRGQFKDGKISSGGQIWHQRNHIFDFHHLSILQSCIQRERERLATSRATRISPLSHPFLGISSFSPLSNLPLFYPRLYVQKLLIDSGSVPLPFPSSGRKPFIPCN